MARSLTKKKNARLLAQIKQWASQQHNNTYNYKQVAHAINASSPIEQRDVAMALVDMAFNGDIIEVSPGKYKTPKTISEPKQPSTANRGENRKNSRRLDSQRQQSAGKSAKSHTPVDRISFMNEYSDHTFVGTLQVEKYFGMLVTNSKFIATDIFIPQAKLNGGKDGDKALVRITEWPEDAKNPCGEVVEIFGRNGENNAEMHAILAEFGLPYSYPLQAEHAAQKIDAGITPDVVAKRVDMRDTTTFTIDPKDAKDFDDALSFKRLPNGNYEVGVHIADVTHYVKPDTLLDREAYKRATSVYLVDRVVPMLPEHLSNGICSLRPMEDKLTFSCLFEMDDNANVLNARIARTVTRSDRRFTYEEAQEVIETGEGDLKDEILTLNHLAKILRTERYKHGSIEFDRAEVKFDIDEEGHPLGVYFKVSKDANKLIEEFMLLANKTVASVIGNPAPHKKAKAFVYRIHDLPDPGKLQDLATVAATLGYKIKTHGDPDTINKSLNKMMMEVKGTAEENFLSTLAIRSMAKATYSTDNIGHYGLGFKYYTHFTSPIRRYPDMMVHRLLDRYLNGGRSVNVDKLEDQCKHSSEMEQLAASAERASIKYKQVEYMSGHLGDEYDGAITGVTEWGLYVELEENLCEGLVPIRDLDDDYYDYDEKNFCLIGRRTHRRYRLGDKVRVQVARTDLEKKQLDFAIVKIYR